MLGRTKVPAASRNFEPIGAVKTNTALTFAVIRHRVCKINKTEPASAS